MGYTICTLQYECFKTFANAHPNNANSQNIVSFWGTSSPDTVPGLCP